MITEEQALAAIEDMDDFARMADIEPIGAYSTLKQFVQEHYQDSLSYKKIKELSIAQIIDQMIENIETEESTNACLCN